MILNTSTYITFEDVYAPMKNNVGIVIVSHNASMAVRITLASLRQATNHTAYKLLLIDNASHDLEREKIRQAMETHIAEGVPWRFIQQEKNLGFSGGNNVGIRIFQDDDEISHVCLLNSDVIVTDFWLDRLIEARGAIVSAITNKADSEQCIPVDYDLKLEECLDKQTGGIPQMMLNCVKKFADDRYQAWKGHIVDVDVTFFCVLLSKRVLRDVGLLDESFFPGGYEDDDYCLRARKLGYGIQLARDVYIHHWGSASFGQLQYEYASSRAQNNRKYLERKHQITWKARAEKPFASFAMDLMFALRSINPCEHRIRFINLYVKRLTALLEHFESEFKNLRDLVANSGAHLPIELRNKMDQIGAYSSLADKWKDIVVTITPLTKRGLLKGEEDKHLVGGLHSVIQNVSDIAQCNIAMTDFLQSNSTVNAGGVTLAMRRARGYSLQWFKQRTTWLFKRGLPFLWHLRGIVFFGGYPYPERQSDGYFQRIKIIDRLFTDRWRIYVESEELSGRSSWIDRPEERVLVLRITGGFKQRVLARTLALLAVARCGRIYFHSILRLRDSRFGMLMHVPILRKAIDIHGVVPEEFRLHNDFYSALLYEEEEKLAIRKSNLVIVVTNAMHNYLRQKYRQKLRAQIAVFPMFPDVSPYLGERQLINGKPVVVYAGGLHKWQQIPKMVEAIAATSDKCVYRLYCPTPDKVRDMLPAELRDSIAVESKPHEELMRLYSECHYGFILREDTVVNHVACPTKLVEYLAMGIVPIVDCEDIGDFKLLGLRFIKLNELLAGRLPVEKVRRDMANSNFAIYERLRKIRKTGAQTIYSVISDAIYVTWSERQQSFAAAIRKAFPPTSLRGKVARCATRLLLLKDPAANRSFEIVTSSDMAMISTCDILVQVDNFEAGGLENVVLDLNQTLMEAGYRLVLLVLGKQGDAVHHVKAKGMPIMAIPPQHDTYLKLIQRVRPKVVLAHYSFHGADICEELGIPFLQVIHNTYMWFDNRQQDEFRKAASHTSLFIAVSEYVKSYSVMRLGIDPVKCVVIPNGIDCSLFNILDVNETRARMRSKYGFDDEAFVFLSVGSVNHQKNHMATVRAFSSITREWPNLRLVILGPAYEQELLDAIKSYVAEKGLSHQVIYAGSSQGAHAYYAMADAFVTASFFEGGPLNQLEALRANLPSIMSDVGFASCFKGRKGIEVIDPPFDIVSYHGRIWKMISTSDFERRLKVAMVHTYRNRHRPNLDYSVLEALDKKNTYQCYIELINDVLNGRQVYGKEFSNTWPIRLRSNAPNNIAAVR